MKIIAFGLTLIYFNAICVYGQAKKWQGVSAGIMENRDLSKVSSQ